MKLKTIVDNGETAVLVPASVLQEAGLGAEITVATAPGRIVLSKAPVPRENWEDAFRRAEEGSGESLLMADDLANSFDRDEWTWPER